MKAAVTAIHTIKNLNLTRCIIAPFVFHSNQLLATTEESIRSANDTLPLTQSADPMRQKSSQSVAVENRGVTLDQEVMSSVNLRSLARKFTDFREWLDMTASPS